MLKGCQLPLPDMPGIRESLPHAPVQVRPLLRFVCCPSLADSSPPALGAFDNLKAKLKAALKRTDKKAAQDKPADAKLPEAQAAQKPAETTGATAAPSTVPAAVPTESKPKEPAPACAYTPCLDPAGPLPNSCS